MNLNLRYTETCINYLANKLMEIPQQQQDAIIRCAMACLENRILYQSEPLTTPYEVRDYLRLQLAGEEREVFAVLFMSNHHRVIAYENLFFGTINSTSVHPRVIVQRAIKHNAAAVIVAHNHPSGSLEPSSNDQYITMQIKSALHLIDVRLLDHIIVSKDGALSFVERGLI